MEENKRPLCSWASSFQTLCIGEWQISPPARAFPIIVCHEALDLETFAHLPACAPDSERHPNWIHANGEKDFVVFFVFMWWTILQKNPPNNDSRVNLWKLRQKRKMIPNIAYFCEASSLFSVPRGKLSALLNVSISASPHLTLSSWTLTTQSEKESLWLPTAFSMEHFNSSDLTLRNVSHIVCLLKAACAKSHKCL